MRPTKTTHSFKYGSIVRILNATNEILDDMEFVEDVPAWARWKAVVYGMTVYFSHKPPRGTSIGLFVGYPANKPNRKRRHSAPDIPYAELNRRLDRIDPLFRRRR